MIFNTILHENIMRLKQLKYIQRKLVPRTSSTPINPRTRTLEQTQTEPTCLPLIRNIRT